MQKRSVDLPGDKWVDGVVQINPTTGAPYTPSTGGAPVSIVGTSGVEAGTNALGQLRVRAESTSLFTEEFDSLDLTNRWTNRSSGGVINAALGALTVSGSTTANAWGGIQSQPTFQAIGLNFLEFGGVFLFPNISIANTKRFFGAGTIPATPTVAVPITDGFGFELDGSGQLWAALYESGVRSPRSVNITSLAGLANNTPIPFILGRRADMLLFYVTNNQKPDAMIPLPGLDVTALPLAFLAVNDSPAPASAPSFVCFGVGIGDTGCNAGSIKDPVNPFWQAAVTKPDTAVLSSQSALAVAVHPSSNQVNTLARPSVPRVQATSGTAASIVLTASCTKISMYATQGTWYSLSGTATSSSHYIGAGERLDLNVLAGTTVSVLQETSAGSIRITELA